MQTPPNRATEPSRRERILAYVSLVSIAAVWGATFFMVKDATRQFPVLGFLAIRFTFGSLALLPFVIHAGRRPTRAELAWGSLAGITFLLGYILQTFALRLGDSGRVGFITGLYVVLVPLLSWLLLRLRPSLKVIIGAAFALVGLTLLSYAPGGSPAGDVLAFLCALSFASQIVIVEKFPRESDWRIMSLLQAAWVAVCSIILLPVQAAVHACSAAICTFLAPVTEAFPDSVPGDVLLSVVLIAAFTGLVATALGLALQVWAQKKMPPSDAALIFAMESPFSALFGWLALGEILTNSAFIGCGLIMTGMLTTTLSSARTEPASEEAVPHMHPPPPELPGQPVLPIDPQ